MVGLGCSIQMAKQLVLGCCCIPSVPETRIGNTTELTEDVAATESIGLVVEVERPPIPMLGFLEVTNRGDVLVRRSEIECGDGLLVTITYPFGQCDRLLVG